MNAFTPSSFADDASEATYTGCVTRGSKNVILHCFPAHVTDLQKMHRDELDRLAFKVRNGDITGRRIRTIRIEGHAASWRGLSRRDYNNRSKARAKAARDYLRGQLNGMGLSYRPRISVSWFGDRRPLVDNRVSSTSRSAQRNREINRRVEIFLAGARSRRKPKKPDKPVPIDWDAFLDTKLRKLRDRWDVTRPFNDDIKTCTLNKLLRPNARTNIVADPKHRGELPAKDPIKWIDLRDLLILDLKGKFTRGHIRNFEKRFDHRAMEMFNGVNNLGFRAMGADQYNPAVASAWRRVTRLSKDKRHPYSCHAMRSWIERRNSQNPF